ncbi:hypothetical protein CAPTEDRAFT_219121 [Capitella teleta]|uniref:OCIA domain-containing protein n=1 Tax=Capitella teleta TaxID=283909 RepID=R7UB69_CAPTE|nr:hypothetical protein CAPTEDRAFT_219121 [Capitella teleta]|eukprot:ELU03610.1 hypothetical protein CAPTEDRAFT_219121 [Capitella teleta]
MSQLPQPVEGQPSTPLSPQGRGPEKVKLEPNEFDLKVLKECREEALRYRVLPISAVLLGMSSLKRNPAGGMGFSPTIRGGVVSAISGYILGRISYASTCMQKLLAEERGNIRKQFKHMQGNPFIPSTKGTGLDDAEEEETSSLPVKLSDDLRSYDIDSDKNVTIKGFDPEFMPTVDRSALPEEKKTASTTEKTSFEELRRINREEYERKRIAGRTPGAAPPPDRDGYYSAGSGRKEEVRPAPPPLPPSKPVRRNSYGDIIEE